MFDSLRSDATARLLFLAGALLLLITLALGVYTVLLRPASDFGGAAVAPSATSAPATSAATAPAPGATATTALRRRDGYRRARRAHGYGRPGDRDPGPARRDRCPATATVARRRPPRRPPPAPRRA